MSASTSPVVTPRKGKHVRSKGQTLSASINESRFNGSISAIPAGVDILTLDPDEAFVRYSVRDVQAIEASIELAHGQLSSKLRLLVSEKYRDMLGTANTLIEMSSSATNLVNRLDAVRIGVDKAKAQRDQYSNTLERQQSDPVLAPRENKNESGLFAIAAATKLLAEAPDDVWRAVDLAALDGVTSNSGKRTLIGRDLINFKAATALRATWIYILCQETWKWLSSEKHCMASDKEADIENLFPYISKQWQTLHPIKPSIVNVSHAGLQGWFATGVESMNRWEEVSASYLATITFLLSAVLLDELSLKSSRELLLYQRKKAIQERLQSEIQAPAITLSRLIRAMAETMIYSFRAFVIVEDGFTLPHLAATFASIANQDVDEDRCDFPPAAWQVLSTLPSAAIFIECLPASVRHYTPRLDYEDAEECKYTTVKVVQDWSSSIRSGQEASFTQIIDRLSTISSIGEAQIQLRESLDRCCNLMTKVCSQKNMDLSLVVEEELKAFVSFLESLLLRRLDVICQERSAELPAAVSNSITSALTLLSTSEKVTSRSDQYDTLMERHPTRFLFDSDLASSNLDSRLRIQTPLVKKVLLSVEQHAQSLDEEMELYAAFVHRDTRKRAKRRLKDQKQIDKAILRNGDESQIDRVLHSYRTAFNSARIALTDELNNRLDGIINQSSTDGGDHKTQLLYLIRIASAFQHSTVLQSSHSLAAKGSNDEFLLRLQKLRKSIVNRWIGEVVNDAISLYRTKVKQNFDPRIDQTGRPSPAFFDSFMQMIDGIQAVGCGYQSEVTALGQDVISAFARSWLELKADLEEQDLLCYSFDSYAICVLLKGIKRSEEMTSKLNRICSILNDQTKEQIEIALQRLRLILTPLCLGQSQLKAQERSTAKGFSSAPPLPMLSINQSKERVALL